MWALSSSCPPPPRGRKMEELGLGPDGACAMHLASPHHAMHVPRPRPRPRTLLAWTRRRIVVFESPWLKTDAESPPRRPPFLSGVVLLSHHFRRDLPYLTASPCAVWPVTFFPLILFPHGCFHFPLLPHPLPTSSISTTLKLTGSRYCGHLNVFPEPRRQRGLIIHTPATKRRRRKRETQQYG